MTDSQPHILVVDDDSRLRELLRRYLSDNDFLVTTASNADEARARLVGIAFDLIVLDLMMPGESGLDFARTLRTDGGNDVPILMLTAMGDPDDRVRGLEHGADDYLSKPFDPRELVLRIRSVLRRIPQPDTPAREFRLGDVIFDRDRLELQRDGHTIHLTSSEASLLAVLSEKPGTVFSRDVLSDLSGGSGGRTVDVQVTRLRRKIEDDPKQPRYLQTVRGQGYVLRPDR
ncbi:MAG: response regulator transcription factor [Rhodospirillales bacterium]|nr:response regulator transcription factor [Rhodospirillales bacterium]MCW9038940.1 response regulator transcription factor [Rhodospirillales bacterium]